MTAPVAVASARHSQLQPWHWWAQQHQRKWGMPRHAPNSCGRGRGGRCGDTPLEAAAGIGESAGAGCWRGCTDTRWQLLVLTFSRSAASSCLHLPFMLGTRAPGCSRRRGNAAQHRQTRRTFVWAGLGGSPVLPDAAQKLVYYCEKNQEVDKNSADAFQYIICVKVHVIDVM